MSPLASRTLLLGVAQAGDRLVAVGQRGHIVVSADGGAAWTQSPVPVSSDLTAVWFVDASAGWAVGHDGVILHSDDGGAHWKVQLDGRRANELLVSTMESAVAAQPDSEPAKALLDEAKRFAEQGPDKPFLDVWFADRMNGFAVGAYNLIFATSDGGQNWVPWFGRTDNPRLFSLHAVRPVAGDSGSSRLASCCAPDREAGRFVAIPTPRRQLPGVVDAAGASSLRPARNVARLAARPGSGRRAFRRQSSLRLTGQRRLLLADVGGRVATSTGGAPLTAASSSHADLRDSSPQAATCRARGPRGAAITRIKAP
jgi:hypothetical protein